MRGVIAREQIELGEFAEALQSVTECLRDAPQQPPSHERDRWIAWCRESVTSLSAQVGRVVVSIDGASEGVQIRVARRPLPPLLVGSPFPVTPGLVLVEAEAPGCTPIRREVDVARGASVPVPLVFVCQSGRVVVNVDDAPEGLQVRVAGQLLTSAQLGTPFTVAPGRVVVEATAPGNEPQRSELDVAGNATATVRFRLLRAAAPVVPSPSSSQPIGQAVQPASTSPEVPPVAVAAPDQRSAVLRDERTHSPIGLVVGGAGLVALAAAAITFYPVADSFCLPGQTDCTVNPEDEMTVRALDDASTGLLISGGILVAAGAVLWFAIHPSRASRTPHATLTLGQGTFGLAGTF